MTEVVTVFGMCVAAFIGANIQALSTQEHYDTLLSSRWGHIVQSASILLQARVFWFVFGMAGGTIIAWPFQYAYLKVREQEVIAVKSRLTYIETRLFLKRPQESAYFIQENARNIYSWQQTIVRLEAHDGPESNPVLHYDSFFFIFTNDTEYARPQINSFGHIFPAHNFLNMTQKGAILQVLGKVKVPMFKIIFPPIPRDIAAAIL